MSNLRLAVLLGAFLVAGCNGSDLTGGLGPTNDDGGGPGPYDPHRGQDAPEPETVPGDGDTDGDGIPDADDFIPCQAFYAKIWNEDVSSGEVALNTQVIVDGSFFPTDEVIVEFINPVPGINEITFGGRVTGSPEDELHTEIWDVSDVIYLHQTIVRGNGQPDAVSLMFEINVTC